MVLYVETTCYTTSPLVLRRHGGMHLEVEGTKYVGTKTVLEAAGVSRQTLWRWRREGRVPQGHRFRNGQLLFKEQELAEIVAYANHVEPDRLVAHRHVGGRTLR